MFGNKRKRYGQMSPLEQAEFAAKVSARVTGALADYAAAYLNALSQEKRALIHSVALSVVPAQDPETGAVGVVTNPAFTSTQETQDRLTLLEVLEKAQNELADYRRQVIQKLGFDPLRMETDEQSAVVRH